MSRAWVVGLLVIASALRLAALGRQSFWYDEAVSVMLAGHPVADLLSFRAGDLGNPPLYPALLRVWTLGFGNGDAAVRALSALLGIATVPLVYAVGRRILGVGAALAGTLLFCLAPFHVQMAQEARTYTLLTLAGVGSVYVLLRALDQPQRWGWWIALGLVVGVMALSHYFGLFLALAEAGYVLVVRRRDRPVLARAAAGFALSAVLFSLWLPSLMEQLAVKGNLSRSAESWYLHLFATPLVFGVGPTLVWKDNATSWRLAAGALAVVLFAICLLLGIFRRRGRPGWGLLLCWLLVPVAVPALISLVASPVYNTRYVILASIPFYLFAGAGLASLPPAPRALGLSGVALVMLLSQGSYFAAPIKHQWREAAAYLEPLRRPDDVLVFDTGYNEMAYAHYAPTGAGASLRVRLSDPPPGTPAGRLFGAAIQGLPVADQTAAVLGHRRAWLLLADTRPESAARDRAIFDAAGFTQGQVHQLKGITVIEYVRDRAANSSAK
jgi:mannosyltransferase